MLPPDLDVLARAMLCLPVEQRADAMATLLARADIADRYRKKTGKLHRAHGDGSVLSLALSGGLAPMRSVCDTAYLAAFSGVLDSIAEWRGRHTTHQTL